MPRITKPKLGNENRGAKPGERRGGRGKGAANKSTIDNEKRMIDAMKAAVELLGPRIGTMSPLEVLKFAMVLCLEQGWVFKAAEYAKEAAPYCHAKLASTEVKTNDSRRNVEEFSDTELEALQEAEIDVSALVQHTEEQRAVN